MNSQCIVALVIGVVLGIALIGIWRPYMRHRRAVAEMRRAAAPTLVIVWEEVGNEAESADFAWPHGGTWN